MSTNRKQKLVFDYTGQRVNKFDKDEDISIGTGGSAFVISQKNNQAASRPFERPSVVGMGERQYDITDRAADVSFNTRSQRRSSGDSTGDDGWSYPLVLGCGNYQYNEIVRQDKMRVFTLGATTNSYPYHYIDTPFNGSSASNINCCGIFSNEGTNSGRLMMGHKDLTGDFYMGMWVYFGTLPSSDMAIVSKLDAVGGYTGPASGASGPTGGVSGGSGDVFKLWADSGTNNLYWSFSEEGEAATGLNKTLTIATIGGGVLPVREWHHVSVNYDSNRNLAEVYVDGSRQTSLAITGDGLKRSKYPLFIGAKRDGTEGTTARIKDLIIRGGDSGSNSSIAGLTGLNHTGTGEQSLTGGVLYYMPMNGKIGCKNFVVETHDYGTGNVTFWDNDYDRLGLRNIQVFGSFESFRNNQGFIYGTTAGAMYLTAATASGGFTANPISVVIETTKGRIDGQFSEQTESEFTLTGSSAAAGHFVNLFGVTGPLSATGGDGILGTGDLGPTGNAGTQFSMIANLNNYEYVTGIYSAIVGRSGGATGFTNPISDANDKVFHMFDRQVIGLYDDLTSYFAFARDLRDSKKNLASQITDATKTGTQIGDINIDYKTPTVPKFTLEVRLPT